MRVGTGTATIAGIETVARAGRDETMMKGHRAGTATCLMTVEDVGGGTGMSLAGVVVAAVEVAAPAVGGGVPRRRPRRGNPRRISPM